MKRSLEISEDYEKNPGLNIGKLKRELEMQISKVLLVTGLLLLMLEIACGVVVIFYEGFFDTITVACFGAYTFILIFLLYAGISSASMLKSIYTDEFSTCVKKVWLILAIFVICIALKIVAASVVYYH
jgi:hypothetical protein